MAIGDGLLRRTAWATQLSGLDPIAMRSVTAANLI